MEVAPCYTLLTLCTLFKLFYTVKILACIPNCCKIRALLDAGFMSKKAGVDCYDY